MASGSACFGGRPRPFLPSAPWRPSASGADEKGLTLELLALFSGFSASAGAVKPKGFENFLVYGTKVASPPNPSGAAPEAPMLFLDPGLEALTA